MIRDARVLQDEFIPTEVGHRDAEMNALSRALDPMTRGQSAETALLFGPSGAGKTCLARFALDRLRETVIDLNHQYVNCWRDYTAFARSTEYWKPQVRPTRSTASRRRPTHCWST